MKKYLALLLTLLIALSLTACGGSGGTTADQSDLADGEEEAAPVEEAAEETADETAEEAPEETGEDSGEAETAELTTVDPGKLTVSTSPDFPPYEFLDDANETVGIEPEIMTLIAEKLGLELQIDEMDFDSALLAVQTGKSDVVMSGVSITEDRKLVMDFTDSYTTAVQVIVAPEDSDVTLENLGEKSIGTQRGTTGFLYTVDEFGDDHVTGYDTYTTAFQALNNGQIDCIVLDDSVARAFVQEYPGLHILDTEYAVEEYAFGVSKGNQALLDAVNGALWELTANGTVQNIIDDYISEE